MKKLIVYGAGGFASVVIDTAEENGWEILGLVDDTIQESFVRPDGLKVYKHIPQRNESDPFFVICAIGNCEVRYKICATLKANGYSFATIIHSFTSISRKAKIGEGVYIGAGSVIDPGAVIGDWCIINKNSVVSHDTSIGRACHIAPAVSIASHCVVGDAVWIGVGTKIKELIRIGDFAFLGAGSVVVKDIDAHVLAYGVPAQKKKDLLS